MKRQHRVLKNTDILNIIKKGKIFRTSHLSFYVLNNIYKNYRITICIAKKVAKLAVTRNKIKRRINTILMQYYDKNMLYDIIIVCKPGVNTMSYQELKSEVDVFLKHLTHKKGATGEQ